MHETVFAPTSDQHSKYKLWLNVYGKQLASMPACQKELVVEFNVHIEFIFSSFVLTFHVRILLKCWVQAKVTGRIWKAMAMPITIYMTHSNHHTS